MLFKDRTHAGVLLAERLSSYRDADPIILGVPRGGVPVAYEIARALRAPLDVWVVRKIGAPDQPELGLGAISEGGVLVLDRELMRLVGASETEVAEIAEAKALEVEQRVAQYRGGRPPLDLRNRTVIVVDDGVATGGTMEAALKALRHKEPRQIVVALPVASTQALDHLRPRCDELICLEDSPFLGAIGFFYEDFTQTSDFEVTQLLGLSHRWLEGPHQPASPSA